VSKDRLLQSSDLTQKLRPLCLLDYGRQRQGKTLFMRGVIEFAQEAGRPVIIGDMDVTNRSLTKFFGNVTMPSSNAEAAIEPWFGKLIQRIAKEGVSACVDVPGGDSILKRLERELELAALMEEQKIRFVVAYFVGGSPEDLRQIEQLEKSWRSTRPATLIIFNEHLYPETSDDREALDKVLRGSGILQELLEKRGATLIRMPRLVPADRINERGLRLHDVVRGEHENPLDLFQRRRTQYWLQKMAENLLPVKDLLP
jgi:hypothetical protein